MQAETNLFPQAEVKAVLTRLQTSLASKESRLFIVGGYIRNGLMGRISHDIDFAVDGDALHTATRAAELLGGKFIVLDELHQIARVILTEGDTRWHLDFAPLRGSIQNDLSLRDFTIDAIAIGLAQLEPGGEQTEFIDPLDGIKDIQIKQVRASNDSVFRDDPLRLLRAFRLAAEFDMTIESHTEFLIERDSKLISGISGERIHEELGRILETSRGTDAIRAMHRLGFLEQLIPELSDSRGVEQPKEHYYDVFDHSIETVAAVEKILASLDSKTGILDGFSFAAEVSEHFKERAGKGLTRKALIKLAALLHDVAKPQTRSFDDKAEKIRFLGHAQQGAWVTEDILNRFRFSSDEKMIVTRMIDQHLRPGHLSNAPEPPTPRAIYRYFRDNPNVGIDILILSLADHLATRGPTLETAGWEQHVDVTEQMLSKWYRADVSVAPPRLIDGHVLMEKLELPPGPQIGRLLESIREAQATGEIISREDAIEYAKRSLKNNHAN